MHFLMGVNMQAKIHLIGEIISNASIGLHGDIITVTALGCAATTTVTQISTLQKIGAPHVSHISPKDIKEQFKGIAERDEFECIKIGALGTAEQADAVAQCIESLDVNVPVIINPVLISDFGQMLLDQDGMEIMRKRIFPKCSLVVASIREAELLTGQDISDLDEMSDASHKLCEYGSKSVLISGGILHGDMQHEAYVGQDFSKILSSPRGDRHRHRIYDFSGGWVLTTAIATSVAQGYEMIDAINRARQFINKAIASSYAADPEFQSLNLQHTVQKFNFDENIKPFSIIEGGKR